MIPKMQKEIWDKTGRVLYRETHAAFLKDFLSYKMGTIFIRRRKTREPNFEICYLSADKVKS